MAAPDSSPDALLRQLLVATTRVEAKLDAHLEHGSAESADHEARIRILEEHRASPLRVYAVPIAALGTVASAVAAAFALVHR